MTLRELAARLADAGIPDPLFEARTLFSRFGGYSPASLIGTDPCLDSPALVDALARRCRREPLQYIIGEVGFYRETYRVTPDCLIPRPDTELLVEEAIRRLPPNAYFADLCCGSGCIAISTLASRTDCTAAAYDVEGAALRIAEENARRNGVSERLTCRKRDLLREEIDGTYAAILSNPPYIPDAVVDTLAPELSYEPRIALMGGEDGMDFYRAILSRTRSHLTPDGFYLFEIGYDQKDAILRLAEAHGMTCLVLPDLGGNPRCAVLQTKELQ